MDANAVISLVSVIAAVLLAIGGGTIKHLLAKVAAAESKTTVAVALADSKQALIEDLRRQVQRLEITADITDKFMSRLPPRGGAK